MGWQFLIDALDETKAKIHTTKNLQINGFAMLLQVCYDHCIRPGLSFLSIMVASFKCCRFGCTSTVTNLTRQYQQCAKNLYMGKLICWEEVRC